MSPTIDSIALPNGVLALLVEFGALATADLCRKAGAR